LYKKLILSLATLVVCTRCDFVKSRLGLDHNGPDEFEVIPLAPLSVPGSYGKTPSKDNEHKANDILLQPQINVESDQTIVKVEAPAKADSSCAPESTQSHPSTEELKRLIKEADAKSKELQKQVEAAAIAASKVNANKMAEDADSEQDNSSKGNRLSKKRKKEDKKKENTSYDNQADEPKELERATFPELVASVDAKPLPQNSEVKQQPAAQFNAVESHTLPSKPLTKEELEEIEFERKREEARLDELKREEELLNGKRKDKEAAPPVEHVRATREVVNENYVAWTQLSSKKVSESKKAAQKFSPTQHQLPSSQSQPDKHEDITSVKASDLSPVIRIIDDKPNVPTNDSRLPESSSSNVSDPIPVLPKVLPVLPKALPHVDLKEAEPLAPVQPTSVKPTNTAPPIPQPPSANPIRTTPVMNSVAVKRVNRKRPVRKGRRRAVKKKSVTPNNLWLSVAKKK
jgi:hypothetical protein